MVVKVGGSLIDHLPDLMPVLKGHTAPLLLVPGGGPFAELARRLSPPGEEAHWMAVAGMEMYGWYIASFGVPASGRLVAPERTTVLLPYRVLCERDPLPHRWEVTSDSIAAWIAGELGLELLLLKSVDGIRSGGRLIPRVSAPLPAEEVDPFLIPFALEHGIGVTLLNARSGGRLEAYLRGEDVPCTRIVRGC